MEIISTIHLLLTTYCSLLTAKVALQKCLIREKDYQLSEQAGYRLDAVVQIAPMHPTITVFGGATRRALPDANAHETHTLDPWRKGTL